MNLINKFTLILIIHSIPVFGSIEMSTFFQLSQELRTDPHLSREQDEERQKSVIEEFLQITPNVGKHKKLDTAISIFAKKNLKLSNNYKIVDSKSTELHGNSEDEVFFVLDKQGKMKYVIKAFINPESNISHFIPEISGNSLIKNLQLPSLDTSTFLAVGKSRIENDTYGLLLETAVSGVRVDHYIQLLENISENDPLRDKILQEAKIAFTAIGEAFAQLHNTHDLEKKPLDKKTIEKIENDELMLENPDIINKLHDEIDILALKTFIQKFVHGIKKIPFSLSYQFNAAHLKNIFYDPNTGKVAFIDTGKLHDSVDREGQPLSEAGFDLIRLQEYLTRTSLGILNEDEVQILIVALYEGYEHIHPLPDERLLEFYKFQFALHKTLKYSDYDTEQNPVEKDKNFQIFQHHLRVLKDYIQSYLIKQN